MATKNLGLVKAIFRQSTSPARTDVLWYDTINSILKYYDTLSLSWKALLNSYTETICAADNNTSILIGPVSTVIGVVIEFAAYRGGFRQNGNLRALFYGGSFVSPYTFEPWINQDSNILGVEVGITNDGANFYWDISVDDSVIDPYVVSYKMDVQSMTNLPLPD